MRGSRILKSCIAGCIVVLSACSVNAQIGDVRMLDSLVVSRKRTTMNNAESAVPSHRLSARDMQRLGATNAGDALKHIGGVTVKDYGGAGGMKSVAIRGMGAGHTAVFYDGVAVGDCQSGQVDLGRFSTENLDALKLTIGQDNDIYSSARMLASAGAVSLETVGRKGNYLQTGVRLGSFDYYQTNFLLGYSPVKNMQFTFFGDYLKSGGDYDFSIKSAHKHIRSERNNSDIENLRGEINFAYEWAGMHTLRAKIYGYYSLRGVPGAVIVDNPLSSERLLTRNFFGQFFYEYVAGSSLRMKTSLKYNNIFDRNKQPASAGNTTTLEYSQHEISLSYTVKWSPLFLRGFSLAFAEDVFHNNLATDNRHLTMSAAPKRVTSLSAVSARYVSSYFSLTGSLLYSYAHDWANSGSVAPDCSRLSPAFSVGIYPFGENFTIRASYKDVFRMPTFNDLYYRESGNVGLRPEKSRMLNFGLAYSCSGAGWLREFLLSADSYYGRVTDKIVAVPGIFIWRMNNVDKVLLSGVDMNFSATLEPCDNVDMNISATYNYMHAVDDTDGSVVKGEQIVYTPEHSGAFSAALNTKFFDLAYSLVWSGVRYRLAQNIPSSEVDAYFDHSVNLSRSWKIFRLHLTAKLEALNIGDKNYEIIRYYPMPGRNYRLTLVMKLL